MLNRLISLVFLLSILNINIVYSENNFILPLENPLFLKIRKENKRNYKY